MKIAVASGKGGTGKTTVATSLAMAIKAQVFIDCDVEAPNAHIFLRPELNQRKLVELPIPEVDASLCTGCGRCSEVCQFHAIVVLGGKTLVFPELCHGCGSCTLVCPENAITERPKSLGLLESGALDGGMRFAHGVLNVGEPMAVPVIRQLKNWQDFWDAESVILDSPPGASCPVVETLKGADFVILVTEPTPFGLHDLKLAFQLTQELNLPTGVVVNRDGIGDAGVDDYCRETGLPIMMRIPFDREIGEGIARGKTLVEIHPEDTERFQHLYALIRSLLNDRGGRA